MRKIRFTKEGYENLKGQFESLRKSRPDAVSDLKKAREMGDLSENGYYKAAKFKLSGIDRQLRIIEAELKQAEVFEGKQKEKVDLGSKVVLNNGSTRSTYHIVGDLEAEPMNGKISLLSPLGKAIAGKKEGEKVTIKIPAGEITYMITEIS